MRRQKSSRLNRVNDSQNKKQALIFSVGIITLIMILIQFGPLLINVFGNIVYTIRGGDSNDPSEVIGKELLQPPVLIGIPEATQSAFISFSGQAPDTNGSIELYVNDELEDDVEITNKSSFEVKKLRINKGANTIKSRFVKGEKSSPFSNDYTVNYLSSQPKLEVNFPQDGQQFTKADKNITVSGMTDPDNTVTINSFRAIVESDGSFSYLLQLNDGENKLLFISQNPAGATTEKEIKVTYTP